MFNRVLHPQLAASEIGYITTELHPNLSLSAEKLRSLSAEKRRSLSAEKRTIERNSRNLDSGIDNPVKVKPLRRRK